MSEQIASAGEYRDLCDEIRAAGLAAKVPGVPRVSDLLNQIQDLSGVPPHILATAADRGRRIHARLERYGLTDKLVDGADPDDVGYLQSALAYRDLGKVGAILDTEIPVGDPAVARGTVDRLELDAEGIVRVVDWKTSSAFRPTHLIQTEMYSRLIAPHMLDHAHIPIGPSRVVHLLRDGSPCVIHDAGDPDEYNALLAGMVSVHRWRWTNDRDYRRQMLRRHNNAEGL